MPRYGKTSSVKLCRNATRRVARVCPEERRADRFGEPEPDRPADQRAEEVGDLGFAQPGFDADDDQPEQRADDGVGPQVRGERANQDGRVGNREDEQNTDDQVPGHEPAPRYINAGYEYFTLMIPTPATNRSTGRAPRDGLHPDELAPVARRRPATLPSARHAARKAHLRSFAHASEDWLVPRISPARPTSPKTAVDACIGTIADARCDGRDDREVRRGLVDRSCRRRR